MLMTVPDKFGQAKVLSYDDLKLDMALRHPCEDDHADALYVVVGANDVYVAVLTQPVPLLTLLHIRVVYQPAHEGWKKSLQLMIQKRDEIWMRM